MSQDKFLQLLQEQPIYLFIRGAGINVQLTYQESFTVVMELVEAELLSIEEADLVMQAIEILQKIQIGTKVINRALAQQH